MKIIPLLSTAMLLMNVLYSQTSLVKQWDYRYGGIGRDELSFIEQTSDHGFVLGGSSSSNANGDKSQDNWGTPLGYGSDYWIVKIDSLGYKEWDKDFGGYYHDVLVAINQTKDGGYILGGYSDSDAGGNKSDDNWSLAPWYDFWIVKIDKAGKILWDRTIGGVFDDHLTSLQQTSDGGFILGGYSNSDISGDKTEGTWGNEGRFDYWVVKTDSEGLLEWDKTFGGSSDDYILSLQQTSDGGYILGGYSDSPISGDKTQETLGGHGNSDYWIIKIDSLGTIQWDKDYGGTGQDLFHSLLQTSDGGYILAGSSNSNNSGDKTENTWGDGTGYDFWSVKINSHGEKEWDKDLGGIKDEEFGSISQTSDGGYLISGTSYSPLSGDKSEDNLGEEQSWTVKTNSQGDKEWDKTLHSQSHDESGFAIQTNDGCYVLANYTNANIGGDKTQYNWDTTTTIYVTPDYWLAKFCVSTITGVNETPNSTEEYTICPNPFSSEVTLLFETSKINISSVQVYNIFGQSVYFEKSNVLTDSFEKTINLSFLPQGIYFLDLLIAGNHEIKKLIKN